MTISNEAVVAAARAMRDLYAQEVCELPVESFFKEASAALEAVAPIIRAEALAPVIESEARAWRALDHLYDLTPKEYNLGDGKEAAVMRAIAHLISLRARAEAERGRQ